jgi:hypothetical protein
MRRKHSVGFEAWLCATLFALVGCQPMSADPEPAISFGDGGTDGGLPIELPNHCVDGDGDGRGPFCPDGWDCDDNDPTRFENCGIPTVGSGDACDVDPSVEEQCYGHPILLEDDPGRALCQRGTRRCLGGAWTSCFFTDAERVQVHLLPLRRDGVPVRCDNPCDPLCGRVYEGDPALDGNGDPVDDFPDAEENDTWSDVDFYPALEPYGDGTTVGAIALSPDDGSSTPDSLRDEDGDGTPECPATDPSCPWGDRCPAEGARDGYADGPDLDGDCIPDRCDSAPDNALAPADRVPTIGGVPVLGCLDGYFWDGVACFTGANAVARATTVGTPICPLFPTSMTAQEMVHRLPYLDPDGSSDSLRVQVAVKTVDVYILFDNTGSMSDERRKLQEAFRDEPGVPGIITQIRTTIPDAWFGLGAFQDFPDTHQNATSFTFGFNGSPALPRERPFQHILDITEGVDVVDCALNSTDQVLNCAPGWTPDTVNCDADPSGNPRAKGFGLETCPGWGGSSGPEAQMSAIQSAITGNAIQRTPAATTTGTDANGATVGTNGYTPDILSRAQRAALPPSNPNYRPACGAGSYGYPCFRQDATPIFMVLTDSPVHNGPSTVPVACCSATAPNGQCMGVHSGTGFTTGGSPAGTRVTPSASCDYPAAMGVQENFSTAVTEMRARGALLATVWSGECTPACREQCELGTLNTCDTCWSGFSRRLTCDRAPPNPTMCNTTQCGNPNAFIANATCDNTVTDGDPSTCEALFATRTTCAGAAAIAGRIGTVGDTICDGLFHSNNCFAGGTPNVTCSATGVCTRNCVSAGIAGTGLWRGNNTHGWGCPVTNPYTPATLPAGVTAFATGRFQRFYGYSLSGSVAPEIVCTNTVGSVANMTQWYAPRNQLGPTDMAKTFCTATSPTDPCPLAANANSWTTQYHSIPAACTTNNTVGGTRRLTAPALTTAATPQYYIAGAAPVANPTCSAVNNVAYTINFPSITEAPLAARPSVSSRAGIAVPPASSSPVLTVCNSATAQSGCFCNPRPLNATPTATNCCVPGERRRYNGAATYDYVVRPTDACPTGTIDGPIETVSINSNVTFTTSVGALASSNFSVADAMTGAPVPGAVVVGAESGSGQPGFGWGCNPLTSSNGCPPSTYQRKYCLETCQETNYRQRTAQCDIATPMIECTYQENSADCSPQCSPNSPEVCECQAPTPGTTNVTGTCTNVPTATPDPTLAQLNAAGVANIAACNPTSALISACGSLSPELCPQPNRVFSASNPAQERQNGSAACSTSTPALQSLAYSSCAAGPSNQRPAVPGCANVPCRVGIEAETANFVYATVDHPNLTGTCRRTPPQSCTVLPRTITPTSTEGYHLPTNPNAYCRNYYDGIAVAAPAPGGAARGPRTCAAGVYGDQADQWRQLARATDSYEADGVTPVIRQISPDGTGLGASVVEAIRDLAQYVRQSVTLRVLDVREYQTRYGALPPGSTHFRDDDDDANGFNDQFPGTPAIDEREFIADINLRENALTQYPNCGVQEGHTFEHDHGDFNPMGVFVPRYKYRDCKPGTKTGFDVVLRNAPKVDPATMSTVFPGVVPRTEAQIFYFFVEVIAIPRSTGMGSPDGSQLALIPVTVIVPSAANVYVQEGWYERDFNFSTYCQDTLGPGTWRPRYRDLTWEPSPYPTQLAGTEIEWQIWVAGVSPTVTPFPATPTLTFTSTSPPPSTESPLDLRMALQNAGVSDSLPFMRIRTVLRSAPPFYTVSPFVDEYQVQVDCMASD